MQNQHVLILLEIVYYLSRLEKRHNEEGISINIIIILLEGEGKVIARDVGPFVPGWGLHTLSKRCESSSCHKERNKKGWNTVVTIVLVEAKDLPDPMADNSQHTLYCKIRLGAETHGSKSVKNSKSPQWRERFELHLHTDHLLRISLWDKGKHKNFMGSCVINLMNLEKERSHEIWKELDDGFGSIHLNVTMCTIKQNMAISTHTPNFETNFEVMKERFKLLNLRSDWNIVGQLHVKVIGAKGFSGNPKAYCILELDNERVKTPSVKATANAVWNKDYVFNVYDVTGTLDIIVGDNSTPKYLGKVLIPLLRIVNGQPRWYALKNKSCRENAKGNCPRILIEMSLFYNPVKASLKVFEPKQTRYIKPQPKFDLTLLYNNIVHVKDTMLLLVEINEGIKQFLEWENKELSTLVLIGWLLFWYNFKAWLAPLLLLAPFLYFWANKEKQQVRTFRRGYDHIIDESDPNAKVKQTITNKISNLPETTLIVTDGVDYICSMVERIYNLMTFKVPFMSYLMMTLLLLCSMLLYFVPVNYLMMVLGTYKYSRKYLNPERQLNNALLDFMSRVPDSEIWIDWKELNVPEPQSNNLRTSLHRSVSYEHL
ncbi:multiple C2 and transmembrane domain-containing protein-like [Hyposmocoma kahamanoa]|uniref:multiple C2 and transmembrane domain-containing protein-like n=1 Tax=Hyposmocoma kahamanoa TaxID=1477025 RepID=UPI000E6D94A2|nr:multiple C2 and transmembrane domain-containing protein-like [Hyposmocoma kahamanoa]